MKKCVQIFHRRFNEFRLGESFPTTFCANVLQGTQEAFRFSFPPNYEERLPISRSKPLWFHLLFVFSHMEFVATSYGYGKEFAVFKVFLKRDQGRGFAVELV